jgi:hypothetical protein
MSKHKPDFDELVGADLPSAERERLRRVHELLVAAGPPPDLEPAHVPPVPPETEVVRLRPRRRLVLVALAAAFLVAAFGAGYVLGNGGPAAERAVALTGTPAASSASASLKVYQEDSGNWPMQLEVKGLVPKSRPYELWLTKNGRLAALCGSFLARSDGTADVRLNAPYPLRDFDAWVVVAEGSKTPLLTT